MLKHERIGALDGLRGVFAVTVMVGHFSLISTHFQAPAFKNVALSVQFFFILSGFALSHGFDTRMRNGDVSFVGFAWQRLARIYPLHILSMAAAGLFMWPILGALSTPSDNFAWVTALNIFLLQCVGLTNAWSWNLASWSISTEFWVGIILLPLAFRFMSARTAAVLSLLGYASLYLSLHTVRTQFAFVVPGIASSVVSTASGLLMGVAICRFARHWRTLRNRTLASVTEALMLVGILYITYLSMHGDIEFIAIACMPILILSVAVSDSWMARVLASRPLVWLGEVSYSVYLLHIPILGVLYDLGLTRIDNLYLRFAVFATAVLLLSWASFRWFEHPIYQRLRYAIGRSGRSLRTVG